MAKKLDRTVRLTARRLVYASQFARAVQDEFKIYEPYIFGYRWSGEGPLLVDADGTAIAQKRGWDVTTSTLHGQQRRSLLPHLFSNDPLWMNRQRPGAKAIERARVDLYAELSRVFWEQSDATSEFQRAMDDAYCYRLGWCKTEFDPTFRSGLPMHRWVDARDMLVDCETKSPRIQDRRWVAQMYTWPLETAQYMAKEKWDAKAHEFSSNPFETGEDGTMRRVVRGAQDAQTDAEEDGPSDFVDLVMVHVKGENPHTMTARFASRRMNDPAGKDDMYDGKDHILILEACGGFRNSSAYKFVARIDWPYPCDPGEFIYTPIALTKDNRSIYPYNIMQPVHPAQVAADKNIQAWNTDAINSSRRLIGIQRAQLQGEHDVEQIVYGDTLPILDLKPGAQLAQAVQVLPFGSPPEHLLQGPMAMQELYRAGSGMNKTDVQVRANQTAYNTSVQNEAAQVQIEDVSGLIRKPVISMARKGLMCARTHMTDDDVARWVNIPEVVDGKRSKKETITRDGVETENVLWTNDPKWDDVRDEIEIDLEPLSIRFTNPDKTAADVKEMSDYQLQVFRIIGDTVAKGGVAAAKVVAQSANETMKMIAKLKNIPNYERFLIDFEKVAAPEPPPLDPNNVMATAKDMVQGTPQQGAANQRLVNQGADPAAMPQDMQAAMRG